MNNNNELVKNSFKITWLICKLMQTNMQVIQGHLNTDSNKGKL